MKTIEEAAEEYINILPIKAAIEDGDIEDLTSHIKVAYKNGAEWALENQWHKIDINKYGYITPKCLKKMYNNDTIVIYNTKYKSKNIIDSDFLKWRCSNTMFTDYDYWMPIKFKCNNP
jgi:hypothetical protein